MCGLFGMVSASALHDFDKEQFKKISFLSSVRGIDSTGYLRVAGSPNKRPAYVNFLKSARDPISFSKLPEVREFIKPVNLYALLGHTRSATKGSVNTQNAHPFLSKCGRFVVFHNGTLNNVHTGYETDSEWLTNKLGESGGDLEKVLPDVLGAYCLVIWDNQEKTITIIRNSQRPLFYAKRGKWKFFYASEEWMLMAAFNIPKADIVELSVHKRITLKYDEHMDFEKEEVEVKATKPFRHQNYGAYGSYDYDKEWFEGGFFSDRLVEELGEKRENLTLPREQTKQQKEQKVHGPLVPVEKSSGTPPVGNLDPSLFEPKADEKDGESTSSERSKTTNVVPFRSRDIIRTRRITNSNEVITEFYLLQVGFSPEDIRVIMEASEELDIDTDSINDLIENGIMSFGTDYLPTSQELNTFVTFFLSKNRAVSLHHYKNLVACGCGICGRDFDYDEMRNWSDQPGSHFSCFGNCTPVKSININ